MIDRLISVFNQDGSNGIFAFNYVLSVMSLLFVLVVVTMKLIKSTVWRYNVSKTLQSVSKNPKGHWFYGHLKMVSCIYETEFTAYGLNRFFVSFNCFLINKNLLVLKSYFYVSYKLI